MAKLKNIGDLQLTQGGLQLADMTQAEANAAVSNGWMDRAGLFLRTDGPTTSGATIDGPPGLCMYRGIAQGTPNLDSREFISYQPNNGTAIPATAALIDTMLDESMRIAMPFSGWITDVTVGFTESSNDGATWSFDVQQKDTTGNVWTTIGSVSLTNGTPTRLTFYDSTVLSSGADVTGNPLIKVNLGRAVDVNSILRLTNTDIGTANTANYKGLFWGIRHRWGA